MSRRNTKRAPVELSPPRTRATRATTGSEDKVVERVTKNLSTQFDQKFAKLEKAMQAMAAATAADVVRLKGVKRAQEDEDQSPPPKKRNQRKPPPEVSPTPSVSNIDKDCDIASRRRTPWPAAARTASAHDQPERPLNHRALPDVNKNKDWSTWLLAESDFATRSQPGSGFVPTSAKDVVYNEDLEAQAAQIYESTPAQISKGMIKTGFFPFKYVTRGPEKRKATMNSLSLAKHIWGIFSMIKDPTVPSGIKPALLNHVDQIVDDCRQYDWATAVRPWSEEVFALVAEGRPPHGWASTDEIRFLRITMSRVSTARLQAPREVQAPRDHHHKPKTVSATSTSADITKGGPPCPDFNSNSGCSLPSGHLAHGKKMIHICSFCLMNAAATFPHSEAVCRNKAPATAHF